MKIKVWSAVFIFCYLNACAGQNGLSLSNIDIRFENKGTQTNFVLTLQLSEDSDSSNVWFAVGFNDFPIMDKANVVICQSLPNSQSVRHFYNNGYSVELLDSDQPTLGLSNTALLIDQDKLTCTFTRQNSNANSKYFDLNSKAPYVVAAYGENYDSGCLISLPNLLFLVALNILFKIDIGYHTKKEASKNTISFSVVESTTSSSTMPTTAGDSTFILANIQVEFVNKGAQTDFVFTSSLGNGLNLSNAWIGVGFNDEPKMVIQNANLV